MSVVSAAKGALLERNLITTSGVGVANLLLNPNFDQDNYPVWRAYNGVRYPSGTSNVTGDFFKGIADWLHYSSLFNSGYATYVGNHFLFPDEPYSLDDFDGYPNKMSRVIKLFGAGQYYNSLSTIDNTDTDRGNAITGPFTEASPVRIVSNTTLSSIDSTTPSNSTGNWTRHEWSQIVSIPDNPTGVTYGVKFGAKIRVASDDQLRPLNFGGMYVAQDSSPTTSAHIRHVNYFGIRDGDATFSLPTGLISGTSGYNWNGLHSVVPSTGNVQQYTPTSTTATEHAMLDQDDYEDFKLVNYSFIPQSGTSRKLILTLYFAENHSYLGASGTPVTTGAVQFFDPFIGVYQV